MNTISANIVANSGVLQKYGIQVKSANGDLKSTYDVLAELKPVWDNLTDAERQALGQTLAGKNQYRVLASVMQNFDHAVEATTTALNSEGSAMHENEAVMESLEARTNLIKKDFQDLANHVIDSQLVKSILSLTHELLQLADTGFGRVLIQLTLLGGIGWGAGHLLKASKIFGVFKSDIVALGKALSLLTPATTASAAASEADAAAKTAEAVATQTAALTALQFLGYLAAGAVVIYGTVKALQWMDDSYQKHVKTLQQLNDEYESLYGTGSEYDQLKAKIGQLTIEERNRLVELEAEKVALEEQLKTEQQITYEKWRQNQYVWDSSVQGQYRDSLVSGLEESQNEFNAYQAKLESGVITTEEFYKGLQNIVAGLKENVTQLKAAKDAGVELDDAGQNTIDFYDMLINLLGDYSDAQQLSIESTEEQVSALQSLIEQLDDLESSLSSVQDAVSDFNDDGELTYSTISDLTKQFADLGDEALHDYISQLTDGDLTAEEFNNVLSDMTMALLTTRIATMGLTEEDQGLVEMMLEDIGVTNSAEIASYLLANAKNTATEATNNTTTAVQTFNATPVDTGGKIANVDGLTNSFASLQGQIFAAHQQLNLFSSAGRAYGSSGIGEVGLEAQAKIPNAQLVAAPKVKVPKANFSSTKGSPSGGSPSGGSPSGGSPSNTTTKEETYLEKVEKQLKEIEETHSSTLDLIESEYNLLIDQEAPVGDIVAKAKEYQTELHNENEALRAFLATVQDTEETHEFILDTQTKINKNSSEWFEWAEKIAKAYEDLFDAVKDAHSGTLSLIESEYDLLTDQGASTENLVSKAKEYQVELHAENEELRTLLSSIENTEGNYELIKSIQTRINENSSKWWDWANKIADIYEDIAKSAADILDKMHEAWEDDLKEQQEALELLQDYMVDYYQAQIDAIDDKIDAVNKSNDALEDQIELEQKLDAIARARQGKVMVYKDGRWQYISDPDAISSATKNLEDYNRNKQISEEINNLEKEKENLELVKSAWSDMTKTAEDDINRWLITQKLGFDTSTAMWQQYIGDVQRFVQQYRDTLTAVNPYGTQQIIGTGGGTSGYTAKSYNPTTGATSQYLATTDKAINFIEKQPSGASMVGGDGSLWYKTSDGKTLVIAKDGTQTIINPEDAIKTSGINTGNSGEKGYYFATEAEIAAEKSAKANSTTGKIVENVARAIGGKNTTTKLLSATAGVVAGAAKWLSGKYADGVINAHGGLSLVGEKGAELRVLNQGDSILPNNITQNLLSWGQINPQQYNSQYLGNSFGSGMNVTIQALNLPNVVDGQGFVDYIRNNLFGQVLSFVH